VPAPASSASGASGASAGHSAGHSLAVSDLFAGYRGIPVVRELSLEVKPGEVVALLGPNGAGKTTTLETIAGLHRPISGTIELSGTSIGGTPAHALARRGFALVPEGRALFPGLTVREHLRLAGGRSAGKSDSASKNDSTGKNDSASKNDAAANGSREEQLLEMLPELRKCLGRKAGLLSGGEQQMLAVGRALVSRPRLLLVDEMSLGLAPVVVERLLPILRRVATELGTSVLFVEQHVALALEISDRAYILAHGRIRLEGAAAELSQRQELLAASYLGETAA
jgi:branched-chain amino acid transport system ATP-binding protein